MWNGKVFLRVIEIWIPTGILNVKDETQYWAEIANNPKNRDEKEMAQGFYNCLDPIAKEFRFVVFMLNV